MSEARAQSLFSIVRQSADADTVAAMEALVKNASDHELCRVNVLDFATKRGLNEERVIAAFLHAARVGIFELSWNVLCPGCGGVLDATATLRNVHKENYECALCAAGYEPTLDEMVEVTFTVSPQVRRIAAHDPNTLSIWDYFRQMFWSSGVDLPATFDQLIDEITIDAVELPPGERAQISLQLPAEFVIVFEPVTHAAQFLDVKGEPTRERQALMLTYNKVRAPTGTVELRPGPLRLSLDNRTDVRVLPSVWIAGDMLHDLLGKRKPFLTANRLLSNQTFHDIYRTDTLDVDQGLKITSLTFLFTDLKGSTSLYERVGDLVAYDLVRAHFRLLHEIVAVRSGRRREDDRRRRDGHVSDAGPSARRGVAHAQCDARHQGLLGNRGAIAQDRYSRGPLPGGDPQRPSGLFRPDREYRRSRARARHVELHIRHRIGGRAPDLVQAAGHRGADAGGAARGIARHCRRGDGLRDSLSIRRRSSKVPSATVTHSRRHRHSCSGASVIAGT